MTKAAFFCVLTKMPYECQTWICMPVVMLLCCTINWSVTKRSRCVCSFICGGCNILKFCIPTKKKQKNIHFYRLWCCSFSQVCGFEPTPWKTCPRAVWLKWANYTAHFHWRWGPHSKVQVHSPSSNGASEREAAWEWGDAGNVSSCVFDKLLGAVGGSRRGAPVKSYLHRKALFMSEPKWRQSSSTWQEGNRAHVGKQESPAVTSELQEGGPQGPGENSLQLTWDRSARRVENPRKENLTGVLILVLIVLISSCFSYNNN